jgi:hypothetical protein
MACGANSCGDRYFKPLPTGRMSWFNEAYKLRQYITINVVVFAGIVLNVCGAIDMNPKCVSIGKVFEPPNPFSYYKWKSVFK